VGTVVAVGSVVLVGGTAVAVAAAVASATSAAGSSWQPIMSKNKQQRAMMQGMFFIDGSPSN
jgi:hypothetical protein